MAYFKAGSLYFAQNSNVVVDNASGDIANFNTQLCLPLLETKLGFSAKQDLHGYDSPWMDSTVLDKKPYLLQPISGTASRYGNYLYDKIVGGTVAWNQMISKPTTSGESNGIVWTSNNDSSVTASGEATSLSSYTLWTRGSSVTTIPGHRYLLLGCPSGGSDSKYRIRFLSGSVSEVGNGKIFTGGETIRDLRCQVLEGVEVTNIKFTPILFDLTQMFGSTIADYIYSLEQSTAGAGVAFFRSLFPEDYYAYNAGELMSVKTTAHVIRNASNTVIGNYPLDSDLELRGIPKLDANNNLYYDGDIYESSGKVTRKYGVVDLGTLTWNKGTYCFYAQPANMAINIASTRMAKYNPVSSDPSSLPDKSYTVGNNTYLYIKDDTYSDAASFKASLNGIYFIYPLTEPTTETADAFTNPQVSDQYGTEEYLDSRTIPIPVGHETYQANICPIEGVDEVRYTHYGVNLVTGSTLTNGYLGNDGAFVSSSAYRCTDYIEVNATGLRESFKITNIEASRLIRVGCYSSNQTFLGFALQGSITTIGEYNYAFTLQENTKYIRACIAKDYLNWVISDAATGSTALIQLGYTYYGGEVIIDKDGKRKIKATYGAKDMGSIPYDVESSGASMYFVGDISDIKPLSAWNKKMNCMSPIYAQVTGNDFVGNPINYTMSGQVNYHNIRVRNLDYSTPTEFKTAMAGVILVYELSDPIIIDLPDGAVIKSIPAVNNIFCDTGDTAVKFRKIGE